MPDAFAERMQVSRARQRAEQAGYAGGVRTMDLAHAIEQLVEARAMFRQVRHGGWVWRLLNPGWPRVHKASEAVGAARQRLEQVLDLWMAQVIEDGRR